MLEYILNFYNNHIVLFYILLTFVVIIEWPITIIWLSLLSSFFNITYTTLFIYSFIGDFSWDVLHYLVWRFFRKKFYNKSKFDKLDYINEKLVNHSLIDKLIVVKFTPPITSIGLMYMWFQKINFKKFIVNDFFIVIITALIISSIWYNFWHIFIWNKNDFIYLLMILFFSFMVFYLIFKVFFKYIVSKIMYEKK